MVKTASTSVIKTAKRARRAFVFFSNEHKPTIRQATGLGRGRDGRKALDTKVAEAWKHLPKEHRQKYLDMEKEDKVRYQREKASGLPLPISNKEKLQKRSEAPKKPFSPFLLFANKQRQVVKDAAAANGDLLTLGELSKRLGAQWKDLPEAERAPFIEQGRLASEQYLVDTQAYLSKQLEMQLDSKRKAAKEAEKADKPRAFAGAYMRFMKANRQRVKEASQVPLNAKDLSRVLGAEWKALSEEAKRPYEKEAAEDQARYREEMQAYRMRRHEEQKAQRQSVAKPAEVAEAAQAAPKVKKHTKKA